MLFKRGQSAKNFEECIRPHLSYLYRVALRLSGNKQDAEDLVQDLILKIHSGQTDLSTLDSPKTWLAKILYRLFVDTYRKKQRISLIEVNPESGEMENPPTIEPLDEANDPERVMEQHYFARSIESAMQSINEEQRMLVVMYEIEGFTLPEISDVLDIPVGTIKSRLHRARIKLRKILESEGTDWSLGSCSVQKGK